VFAEKPAEKPVKKSESSNTDGNPVKAGTKDVAAKKDQPKPTIWQKVKHEAKHYWEGTKLLGYEIRVSSKLALKLASGRELSRREDRQLKRTLQDIVRIVPFAMFVLVPFAELLLPIALKLFPNLLPSTYETSSTRTKRSKKLGDTRSSVGMYLRDTMKSSQKMMYPEFRSDEQRQDFENFFASLRDGDTPTKTQILTVARMFRDDNLLDNLTRPQLAAMATYMNIRGFGTSTILRYQIRHKMRLIKQDDRVIEYEGVDSLNAVELNNAAQSRGFKTLGVSTGRLRDDLSNWLQLRLHDRVPSTFLILASAYTYGGHDMDSVYDGILNVLKSLPPEVYHETELELQSDQATNAQRLEVLKEQDDLIREENKEEQESGHVVQVRDNLNVDDDERAPQPTTASEADVKADQAWYEKADENVEKQSEANHNREEVESRNRPVDPTESEIVAKENMEKYAEADKKAATRAAEEAASKARPVEPTESEIFAKMDNENYAKADKKAAAQATEEAESKARPVEPTESEVISKTDNEFYAEADKKAFEEAESKARSVNPTESEIFAKMDNKFYAEADKKAFEEAESKARSVNPTESEIFAKMDNDLYAAADKKAFEEAESKARNVNPTESELLSKLNEQRYAEAERKDRS